LDFLYEGYTYLRICLGTLLTRDIRPTYNKKEGVLKVVVFKLRHTSSIN